MLPHNITFGTRYGRLTVLAEATQVKYERYMYVRCDCGNLCRIRLTSMRQGKSTSCGCFHNEVKGKIRLTHGFSGAKRSEYGTWCAMIQRCTNPRNPAFPRYGGRGIKICERWTKFEHFYSDMGDRPPKKSLDRIDTNGNYCPDNCRWATNLQQSQNRRNNIWITFRGETHLQADWARRLKISSRNLQLRLKLWPIERALTEINSRL